MIRYRSADPPEWVDEECEKLFKAWDKDTDGLDYGDNGFISLDEYMYNNASAELRADMDKARKEAEELKKQGIYAG